MNNLFFSILLPTYKGEKIINETLLSIINQSFTNYEIIIQDDNSNDNIEKIILSYRDKRIKFFKNEKNLGYPGNLESLHKKARGDILYLMGQDDILANDALLNTYKAFLISDNIGAVTRPYYWFDKNINTPVRAKKQIDSNKNTIISINDNYEKIITMFSTLDQLSGLAMRRKFITQRFHPDIFPCHVYPFASIFKNYPIIFLKDYNVAVRIRTSQSRTVSTVYNKSPIQSWVDLFENIFFEEKYIKFRKFMITNFVAKNYIGLIQIKNYARFKYLIREIFLLIKYNWQNIFQPLFWFFSFGSLIIPSFILRPMVDLFKQNIYSLSIKKIKFSYVQ